jgi:hypothetical protein
VKDVKDVKHFSKKYLYGTIKILSGKVLNVLNVLHTKSPLYSLNASPTPSM